MNYVGVDVSKDHLHVFHPVFGARKVRNNAEGFRALKQFTGTDIHLVMETSGVYSLKLAYRLSQWKIPYTLVNALKIKMFRQMQLVRIKTDKRDAMLIYQYAVFAKPARSIHPPIHLVKIRQIQSAIDQLNSQLRKTLNALSSLKRYPHISLSARHGLEEIAKLQRVRIQLLEESRLNLIEQHYSSAYQALRSIPHMGEKIASVLILTMGAFENFKNAKQVIAFAGLAPRIHQSGTSVNRRPRMTKMGNPIIRKYLYMHALSTVRKGGSHKGMFQRMKAAGKPGKVVLMAICTKVLRQCFAIVKSGGLYDENYVSKKSLPPMKS